MSKQRDSEKIVALNVRLPESLRTGLKIKAVKDKNEMGEMIVQLLAEAVQS
jgi:hypothetical protein